MWGDDLVDDRGGRLEDFIHRNSLCLLNDGSYTYIHPGNGRKTAIDLSLCHPNLFLDFDWHLEEDQCGSDHYPIVIKSNVPQPEENIPK